jgi:hypothetical protein
MHTILWIVVAIVLIMVITSMIIDIPRNYLVTYTLIYAILCGIIVEYFAITDDWKALCEKKEKTDASCDTTAINLSISPDKGITKFL